MCFVHAIFWRVSGLKTINAIRRHLGEFGSGEGTFHAVKLVVRSLTALRHSSSETECLSAFGVDDVANLLKPMDEAGVRFGGVRVVKDGWRRGLATRGRHVASARAAISMETATALTAFLAPRRTRYDGTAPAASCP